MIYLEPNVIDAIRRHGETVYPEECCGVLLGRVAGDERRVVRAHRITNARRQNRERRFLITADDYRDAEGLARHAKLLLIGFYHSHPDHPAVPSAYDLAHALPWHSYVIVAIEKGQARSWTSWTLAADRSRFEAEAVSEWVASGVVSQKGRSS